MNLFDNEISGLTWDRVRFLVVGQGENCTLGPVWMVWDETEDQTVPIERVIGGKLRKDMGWNP